MHLSRKESETAKHLVERILLEFPAILVLHEPLHTTIVPFGHVFYRPSNNTCTRAIASFTSQIRYIMHAHEGGDLPCNSAGASRLPGLGLPVCNSTKPSFSISFKNFGNCDPPNCNPPPRHPPPCQAQLFLVSRHAYRQKDTPHGIHTAEE